MFSGSPEVLMADFELVCVDMFQTLVNLDTVEENIWKGVLGEYYTPQLKAACAYSFKKKVYTRFHLFTSNAESFMTVREIVKPFFEEVRAEQNLNFDPDKASEIFIVQHGFSQPYPDTFTFLNHLKNKIPVCLVSDADTLSIEPLLKIFSFDSAFFSEKYGSYKNDISNRLFKEVIKFYGIAPEKIIHIGDSPSDIQGAKREKMTACWLNRNARQWNGSISPDHTVSDLTGVLEILNIKKSVAVMKEK